MTCRGLAFLLILSLSLAIVGVSQASAAPASPQIGSAEDAAAAFANAMAGGQKKAAYDLLSASSRAAVSLAEWEQSLDQKRPAMRKPPANAIIRAMATSEPAAKISNVVVHAGEALVEVSGNVEIAESVVLVKDASGWAVDLQATDEANGRQAASDFLEALRAETELSRVRQVQEASMPLLRALLANEAKDFKVTSAKTEGNRAEVTVTARVPVNLVLRATRTGPGWTVDLARPTVPVDISSQDPMKQAIAMADQSACEEQIQRLVRGIQMYANTSGGMLPNPDKWIQQIKPFLLQGTTFHCPNDPQAGVSYAMNRNLAGKRMNQIANPNLTVLIYESALHGDNPADLGASWPKPPRHAEGNLVAFADGSVTRGDDEAPLRREGRASQPAPRGREDRSPRSQDGTGRPAHAHQAAGPAHAGAPPRWIVDRKTGTRPLDGSPCRSAQRLGLRLELLSDPEGDEARRSA